MKFYSYDRITKEYIEELEGYLDPVATEKTGTDVYMMPAYCTEIAPPEQIADQTYFFDGSDWVTELDYRGQYQCSPEMEVTIVTQTGALPEGYIIVTEEQASKIKEDDLYYIIQGGALVENPNYETDVANRETERKNSLTLTKQELFTGLYQAKGVTPSQIEEKITDPQTLIDFQCGTNYTRADALIQEIETQTGLQASKLDKFFESKNYKDLLSGMFVNSDGTGLTFSSGFEYTYMDWETGEDVTGTLPEDLVIPDLTQQIETETIMYFPPSMVNTQYGTALSFTAATNVRSGNSTSNIQGLEGYPVIGTNQGYTNSWSGDTYKTPSSQTINSGSGGSFSSNQTKENAIVEALVFECKNMNTSQDYFVSADCYVNWNGGSTFVHGNCSIYLVDFTNKVVLNSKSVTKGLATLNWISSTYTPPTSTCVFGVLYVFETVKNNYSGTSSVSYSLATGSSYSKAAVRPTSYTYNYDKTYYLSYDVMNMGEGNMFYFNASQDDMGNSVASFKVSESSGVYDLQVIEPTET